MEEFGFKLSLRATRFGDLVTERITRRDGMTRGESMALRLFKLYASSIADEIEEIKLSSSDDQERLLALRALETYFRQRVDLYDARFARSKTGIPRSLESSMQRECLRLGLGDREIAITSGTPGDFHSIPGGLGKWLFADSGVQPTLDADIRKANLIVVTLPEIEGASAFWQPIVLGHEFAHHVLRTIEKSYVSPAAWAASVAVDAYADLTIGDQDASVTEPEKVQLRAHMFALVVQNWFDELVCDAYTVARFGAAGLAAIDEHLRMLGAVGDASFSHPPTVLRTELMAQWLGDALMDGTVHREIANEVSIASSAPGAQWIGAAADLMRNFAENIWSCALRWFAIDEPYVDLGREDRIGNIATELAAGIPAACALASKPDPHTAADLLNGCWLASSRNALTPVDRLTKKALEDLEFVSLWLEVGGSTDHADPPKASGNKGCLSAATIRDRLEDDSTSRLVVTPRMPGSLSGASIDLRLGSRFVVFRKAHAGVFDPLDATQDPRQMQSLIELAWGETFYLHPNQLVLAHTLEYLVVPNDLSASVVTRSSLGRLGLLSATAVQVHPLFHGCLTLELVNLGEMPVAIMPGERVAQLMLWDTTAPVVHDDFERSRYKYPTGPEFSKIHRDEEFQHLRAMRRLADGERRELSSD